MDRKPKVVLDTTALVSAFLTPQGVAAQVLNHTVSDCILVLSTDILAELTSKLLTKRKIRKAYHYADADVREYVEHLTGLAGMLVTDAIAVSGVVRDPEDDMIVACAATVSADFVITRDKDLLILQSYGLIRFVTPREFLIELSKR
jgi:putative PIN family toxin of toxin-antitoxin system